MDAKRSDEELKRSVMEQLDVLDAEDKEKVLDFSRELGARREQARGHGGSLLAFAGAIPEADLAEMRQTIEEGCEKVDEEEW